MVGDDDPLLQSNTRNLSEFETSEFIEEKQAPSNCGVSRFDRAVSWLTAHLDTCPRPLIPYVKYTYDLTYVAAVEAIRLARLKRGAGVE